MKLFKILLLASVLFTSCKTTKYSDLENGLYADIQTNKGDILVKLFDKDVPMTVANFVALSEGTHPKMTDSLKGKPFYDGTKFHRVIKDFMIQGGDKTGTGSGDAGYVFADEFPMDENGEFLYKHDGPGIISMANYSRPVTNSSQFFITHKATPWLDGGHSVFGRVLKGQPVVDTIQKGDYIKKVEILRIGDKAKKFNAASVFEHELENVEKKEAERKQKLDELKQKYQEELGINEAITTNSGLKILSLQQGKGKKVNPALPTTAHYTLYLADGRKIDSSIDKGEPFVFTIDDEKYPLIAGFKEGLKTMSEGDKVRLFIPSYLGYGDVKFGPIPGKSDLIFEVEVLKVGK